MKNIDDIFREKYEKYSKMLFRIAFLHLGNTYDAEDVLQNVFMKLLYSAPRFSDEEHEKAWFVRVLKSSSRRNNSELNEELSQDKVSDLSKAIDISLKIKALPANYKTAIYLYYYEDLTTEQISKILKTL